MSTKPIPQPYRSPCRVFLSSWHLGKGKSNFCSSSFIHLISFLSQPQHALPDVFLWLISGNKRLAYQGTTNRRFNWTPTLIGIPRVHTKTSFWDKSKSEIVTCERFSVNLSFDRSEFPRGSCSTRWSRRRGAWSAGRSRGSSSRWANEKGFSDVASICNWEQEEWNVCLALTNGIALSTAVLASCFVRAVNLVRDLDNSS